MTQMTDIGNVCLGRGETVPKDDGSTDLVFWPHEPTGEERPVLLGPFDVCRHCGCVYWSPPEKPVDP